MAQTQSAKARVEAKLRAFYEGLPEDERLVIAQMMATDGDVRGYQVPDGVDANSITIPSFDAVFATRFLDLPEFDRTASIDERTETRQLDSGTRTVQIDR